MNEGNNFNYNSLISLFFNRKRISKTLTLKYYLPSFKSSISTFSLWIFSELIASSICPSSESFLIYRGFSGAQLVKNPPAMQETWVQSLVWEDPREKGMTTHSSILA